MSKNNVAKDLPVLPQVSINRLFEAPVDLVFSMWTKPEYLIKWWGPQNNVNSICEMELRPGGTIRIVMNMEDGGVIHVHGIFNEVIAPCRLVFTTIKEDETGTARMEVLHTVSLTEEKAGTRMVMNVVIVKTGPEFIDSCQDMETGWNQCLGRLAEQLLK